jgi:hypothetical protein
LNDRDQTESVITIDRNSQAVVVAEVERLR